jgi:hypothetical protein
MRDQGPDAAFAAVWRELRAEVAASAAPTVVISSEEFDTLDDGGIERAGGALAGLEVVPVVFIRGYADLAESLYRTYVVHYGETADIAAFVRAGHFGFDLPAMLTQWWRVSGGRLKVVDYDDPAVRRDSIAAFANACGVPAPTGEGYRANESAPAFLCVLARERLLAGAPAAEVKTWVSEMARLVAAQSAGRYGLLPHGLRQELDGRYRQHLKQMAGDRALRPLIAPIAGARHRPRKPPTLIRNHEEAVRALNAEVAAAAGPAIIQRRVDLAS